LVHRGPSALLAFLPGQSGVCLGFVIGSLPDNAPPFLPDVVCTRDPRTFELPGFFWRRVDPFCPLAFIDIISSLVALRRFGLFCGSVVRMFCFQARVVLITPTFFFGLRTPCPNHLGTSR